MTIDVGNEDPERGHWFVHILDKKSERINLNVNLF